MTISNNSKVGFIILIIAACVLAYVWFTQERSLKTPPMTAHSTVAKQAADAIQNRDHTGHHATHKSKDHDIPEKPRKKTKEPSDEENDQATTR